MKWQPHSIMIKCLSVPSNLAYSSDQVNVLFSQDLQVLGHRIIPTGRFPTTKGTEAISAMPRPKNASGVKRFLGMVGYFRDMFNRTKHLRALLHKGIKFITHKNSYWFTGLQICLLCLFTCSRNTQSPWKASWSCKVMSISFHARCHTWRHLFAVLKSGSVYVTFVILNILIVHLHFK